MKRKQPNPDAYFEFGLASRKDVPVPFDRFHRHSEIEVVYVESGGMTYLFSGGRMEWRAGDRVVFWGAMPHQLVAAESGTQVHWLTVPLAWFLEWRLPAELVERLMGGGVICQAAAGAGAGARALAQFESWHADLRSGHGERRAIVLLEVESLLRRMALAEVVADKDRTAAIVGGFGGSGPSGVSGVSAGRALQVAEPSKVEAMSQYIALHYREAQPVAAIAAAVGLNPEYATTLFRKTIGRSLVQYVTEHRISHAQRLLATTDRKVLDIGLESGFRTASRFYAAFEAACHCSPRAYRAGVRGGGRVPGGAAVPAG